MAKNIVKNMKQPVAMSAGVKSREAEAASKDLKAGAAYEAPMANNAKRNMPHLGAMPAKGDGRF